MVGGIAVLGWGSLIWSPRVLKVAQDRWHPDGPLLPIEFARISTGGQETERLTLVLRQGAASVRTLWARSAFDEFEDARDNLATREGTPNIGYVRGGPQAGSKLTALTVANLSPANVADLTTDLVNRLETWRVAHGFDAVIWSDLASNFEDLRPPDAAGHRQPLTQANAVNYLQSLGPADARAAEEYVRRAPSQVRTAIREGIEVSLGWLPLDWLPKPTTAILAGDDLRLKEWAECRATVGRLDTILVDLRKLGFSFITALLTASAFLSFLGVPTKDVPAPPLVARVAPFIVIMFLIAALFSVDNYYEVLLSGAVERALDLETETDPPIRLTKYVGINALLSKASMVEDVQMIVEFRAVPPQHLCYLSSVIDHLLVLS